MEVAVSTNTIHFMNLISTPKSVKRFIDTLPQTTP